MPGRPHPRHLSVAVLVACAALTGCVRPADPGAASPPGETATVATSAPDESPTTGSGQRNHPSTKPRLGAGCKAAVTGISDYAAGANGDPTPPVEQARARYGDRYEGIEPELAAEDEYSTYVTFSRPGRGVVAVLQYIRVEGGWLLSEDQRCTDPPAYD